MFSIIDILIIFCEFTTKYLQFKDRNSDSQGNRIKKPPSFCIRQCGEDIFTTIITAGGNKWSIVSKKVV